MQPNLKSRSTSKHNAILQAASTLFLDNGPDASSMDEVAQLAGVSKQTVYNHFNSKEDLFSAVIRCKTAEYGLNESRLQMGQSCAENLEAYCQALVDLLLSEEALKMERLCISKAVSHPHLMQLFYEAGPKSVQQTLEHYLRRQSGAGTLAIDDPELASIQLLSVMQGYAVNRALWNLPVPHRADIIRYVKSGVASFIRAHQV